MFARFGDRSEKISQRNRTGDQRIVGNRFAGQIVGDRKLAAVNPPRLQQRGKNRAPIMAGFKHHVGHDIRQDMTAVLPAGLAPQMLGRAHLSRRQNADCDFGKPAQSHHVLQAREMRIFGAFDPDRQHHGM